MLNEELFETIVRYTPLISVDLLVINSKSMVLLGWRNNSPAKDSWFVPGGRILKDETVHEAFNRISYSELGIKLNLEDHEFVGVYEHLYPRENFKDHPDLSTHYIVLGFRITGLDELGEMPLNQHQKYKWLTPDELLHDKDVHQNVKNYFNGTRLF